MEDREIDKFDWRILNAVQADGRLSLSSLSAQVGLSKTPCQIRLKRLEEDGYITGYHARLNMRKIRKNYVVFIQVKLEATSRRHLEQFNNAARKIDAIQSCHMMAGGFDYLLKVRCRNMEEYRSILTDSINDLPGVYQTTTFPVMEEVKRVADVDLTSSI
ncbi:Lrp/AsnC family transcriptional regulator [Parasphingorhabdus cellanae]|uniref:Lrp/AsnC ligand binding domain-containing protein n=1 Tax=Parasphingorhabdus cellanae TaxID=2806553 RepID=A0ABX7T387_9SPHN|nr:Lrp/AsnC ligand binding domain-containing protein [Parasphingorhabdus cellanae]QTD56035.1 Lrp/AsnC ligand binding domain-containing protein [Parasphingorhabdus cellanae]